MANLVYKRVSTDQQSTARQNLVPLQRPKFGSAGLDPPSGLRSTRGRPCGVARATYTLRVTAVPAVHRRLLARCQPLDGVAAFPAQRKSRREYANRVNTLGE
ncbi:hypothetical protein [Streptomyces rimosus]|uniref:hypothetical protein n=1 Tax=Streptomyces rimosus TaxID=1927 RepID=UPI0006B28AAC|nr:hypothetical protein [Streptomyces rimosus]